MQTHKRRKERLVESKLSSNLVLDTWELYLMKILNAILAQITIYIVCVCVWCGMCMYVQWVPVLTDSLYLNMQVIIFTTCIWKWYLSIYCLEYCISNVLFTCTMCKTHPCFSRNFPITNQRNQCQIYFCLHSLTTTSSPSAQNILSVLHWYPTFIFIIAAQHLTHWYAIGF